MQCTVEALLTEDFRFASSDADQAAWPCHALQVRDPSSADGRILTEAKPEAGVSGKETPK